jgi:hypothetical protein
MSFIPHSIFAGDKNGKNEMDGACSMNGKGERRVQGFIGEI